MFWVFDEVKRGIYKRTAVMQESENHSKNGANIELSLSDTLEIKGIRLKFFCTQGEGNGEFQNCKC